MTSCEFSVIKYVPDIVKFEPVNIGISLLDKKNKKMHNKYITNFELFFKRLGVEKIHGFEKSFENYKKTVDVDSEDYLWKLHNGFHGSVFYSEPVLVDSESIDQTMQQLYNKMISLSEKESGRLESISIIKIKSRTKYYIIKLDFPKNTYHEKYAVPIVSEFPPIHDFAFTKNDELINTIDVFNFNATDFISSIRLFFYDIKAIIMSEKFPNYKPFLFSTLGYNEKRMHKDTEKPIEAIGRKKIPIIQPDSQEKVLQEIRSTIV